jgi:hypothetical protein
MRARHVNAHRRSGHLPWPVSAALAFAVAHVPMASPLIAALEPRGKVWAPFPCEQRSRIGPRRQGFASPLRAPDRSGPTQKAGLDIRKRGLPNRGVSEQSGAIRPAFFLIAASDQQPIGKGRGGTSGTIQIGRFGRAE